MSSYNSENIFQKLGQNIDYFRHTILTNHYETCTIKSVNKSSSSKRKMMPDRNLDLCKRIKSTRNDSYITKDKEFFLII